MNRANRRVTRAYGYIDSIRRLGIGRGAVQGLGSTMRDASLRLSRAEATKDSLIDTAHPHATMLVAERAKSNSR